MAHPAALRNTAAALAVFLSVVCAAAGQSAGYDQPYRPQVHFSPLKNWTNDPNGLVYFHGEYHLFFQHNPFGDTWGHMSWGHAVSTDLLHWRQLPVAIPEQGDEMVFTGSVVVDTGDTSGLCAPQKECMVAVYTGHFSDKKLQNQNLAYSRDNGRTWTRYRGNPVLDLQLADFRDPGVFRDEKQHRWIMAVALPKEHKVRLYSSPNLKQWTQLSDFGPSGDIDGDWECPNLLRVPPAKGTRGDDLWVMKVGLNPGAPQGGSGEQYFIGNFDGTRFTTSTDAGAHGWTNYGKDDYCAISFNHLPPEDAPVLLGWMNNWQYADKLPTSPWRGQMSLPRRLTWIKDAAGIALQQEPVIAPLRGAHNAIQSGAEINITAPFEMQLRFDSNAANTGLRLYSDGEHFTEIGLDRSKQEFYIDRTRSGLEVAPAFPARTSTPIRTERPFDLRLVVDRSSVEAYARKGTIAMTDLIFPSTDKNRVVFFSGDGKKPSVTGDLWKLRSIWNSEQSGKP